LAGLLKLKSDRSLPSQFSVTVCAKNIAFLYLGQDFGFGVLLPDGIAYRKAFCFGVSVVKV
jgi:hypothetical protein